MHRIGSGAAVVAVRQVVGGGRRGAGGAQLIMFDRRTGAMIGGSTPHKDGMAVVY